MVDEDGSAAAYPASWEADVVLGDGGTAHLRPIRPSDADALARFHDAQSEESVYARFFAPYPHLSQRDLHRFTHVDHRDRVALVAVIGEDIVGVVRYDKINASQAEVAFNIADSHQGRGLGSVLLEHIAAAARDRGITRFFAETLPTNTRMIKVFEDAGYRVARDYDDGVVAVDFDLTPTENSLAVMRSREHRAEAQSILRLLFPRHVAVVGASRAYRTVGRTVLANLEAAGFSGELSVVNPGALEVAGRPAYPTVLDVPGEVDLAIVAVPAEAVGAVVLDCAQKGVRGLVVLSVGFGEDGAEEGRRRQRDLVRLARSHGMRVVGPSSFGVVNTDPAVRLNASLAPVAPATGRIGMFSQAGALGLAILDAAAARGLGLSTFVSAGNRADVSVNDLLQYWQDDVSTSSVLLYLESIGNPRKFTRLARRLAALKPVVALRSGRASQGVPVGHSVRESRVPREAVDALFRQAGVIRVESISQLFDVGQLVATQPLPEGDRVAVVGNSDALGLLTADALESWRMQLAGAPCSVRPEATAEEFAAAVEQVYARDDVDSVVAVFMPPLVTPGQDVAAVVASAAQRYGKTTVSTFLGIRGVPEQLRGEPDGALPPRGSVPSYPTPEEAVRALVAASRYAAWRRKPRGTVAELDVDAAGARELVEARLAAADGDGRVRLAHDDAARLLACYGVRVEPTVFVSTVGEAVAAARRLGYPVVLKTAVPALRSRPDLSDVRLDLADSSALVRAWSELRTSLGEGAVRDAILQRMAPVGVPVVVQALEDPLFGPTVSFGVGGVASELLGDRTYRFPPLTSTDVADMVRGVKALPLLTGHRGSTPVDLAAVEDLVARVAALKDDLPEVGELVLDPVLASGGGTSVLRAVVWLERPDAREDVGPRRLA
ncbi:acyl-CoA synthetase (NDP forming) [Motilibacter rhizosphaerae]|uniref:Acyl-CoA synthetase (NDP forming) n=1 Tax=Motilibacter rhizosphaerae TaxID=598652 RepID=A0A4Q7NGP1_9ACTN|nr:GNAT family N-acetyltransferase [Motilibacter rhizosphaerae]RZS82989.1 acyl-CoA synthetase (NDP forming) [Motilibacter rhizosphaerae]